jgi:hypothetical protein
MFSGSPLPTRITLLLLFYRSFHESFERPRVAGDEFCMCVEYLSIHDEFERGRAKYTIFKVSQIG